MPTHTHRDGDASLVYLINFVVGVAAVYSTADRLAGPQYLLHRSRHVACHGTGPHGLSNVYDILHSDIPRVLDCGERVKEVVRVGREEVEVWIQLLNISLTVLLLLSVPRWLLESFDDECCCTGHDRYFGLPVLNGQLDCDPQPFPLRSCLGNVISDLLRRLRGSEEKVEVNYI